MNIVITDGFTLNPSDLSWSGIEALGNVSYFDRSAPFQLFERCKNAHVILTNKTPISAELISQCPDLQLICVTATGYNIIDGIAAKAKKIVVSNVPGYSTDSVAQQTFALLLELNNQVGKHAQKVKEGNWVNARDWCFQLMTFREIAGKTLGIIGYGTIGQKVAQIAKAFGMKVIFASRTPKHLEGEMSIEKVFENSDFLSLHCPQTLDNKEFVNMNLLKKMKSNAFLINTARGGLINEYDLAEALDAGILAGAGLDVLSAEPPKADNPLLKAANCIITPHVAWISKEGRQRVMEITAQNIINFKNNTPINQVI